MKKLVMLLAGFTLRVLALRARSNFPAEAAQNVLQAVSSQGPELVQWL